VIPVFTLAAAASEAMGRREVFHQGLREILQGSIFGDTADGFLVWLTNVAEGASWQQIGLFGSLSALFVGYQLYAAVLFDLQELLDSGASERSWLAHFAYYPAFLVWTTVFLVGGVLGTGLMVMAGNWWMAPLVWLASVTTLAVGAAIFGRAKQSWTALCIGGAAAATWLEAIKLVFVLYSTSDYGTNTLWVVYRQLAFAPLAFLWMHLIWFSVLLGTVVMGEVGKGGGSQAETRAPHRPLSTPSTQPIAKPS
jgi:hypothetical protein